MNECMQIESDCQCPESFFPHVLRYILTLSTAGHDWISGLNRNICTKSSIFPPVLKCKFM